MLKYRWIRLVMREMRRHVRHRQKRHPTHARWRQTCHCRCGRLSEYQVRYVRRIDTLAIPREELQ